MNLILTCIIYVMHIDISTGIWNWICLTYDQSDNMILLLLQDIKGQNLSQQASDLKNKSMALHEEASNLLQELTKGIINQIIQCSLIPVDGDTGCHLSSWIWIDLFVSLWAYEHLHTPIRCLCKSCLILHIRRLTNVILDLIKSCVCVWTEVLCIRNTSFSLDHFSKILLLCIFDINKKKAWQIYKVNGWQS